jgi:glycosyltransferase involved in cell wall biosynthesis
MNPLVSVIVPTRNRPALLRDALTSIGAQHLDPGSVEVVVVNDAGKDVSTAVAEAVEHGLPARAINLPSRCGLSMARNAGLAKAAGRYVAFLDDDDIFLPDHLSTVLPALESGRARGVYTTCLVSHQRVDPLNPQPTAGEVFDYTFDRDLLTVFNYIPVHSLVMARPGCRFDRELAALEDWDMWLRLTREQKYDFEHVAAPTVVYHRLPGQSGITADAAARARAYQELSSITRRVWRRWPAANPRAAHFRAWLGVMNWHVLAHLAQGRILPICYYERTIRAITAAWRGESPEDELIEHIAAAIEEDPHAGLPAA